MKTLVDFVHIKDNKELAKSMWHYFIDEAGTIPLDTPIDAYVNIVVAKARAVNRIWNEISAVRPELKPDVIKALCKACLSEKTMPAAMRRAAEYL